MSRFARKVDDNQAQIVYALRANGCLVQSLAALGNGCPDLLVASPIIPHRLLGVRALVLLEIKRPGAARARKQLGTWAAAWKSEGCPVHLVETPEQAMMAVGL